MKLAALRTIGHQRSSLPNSFGSFAAQQIEQKDGEGGFIHLDAAPVGTAVEPEILRPVAGGFLSGFEIAENSYGVSDGAGGEQCAGSFDEIAGPDEVIAAEVFVAFVEAPGDGEAGDDAAEKILGFVSAQDGGGGAVEIVRALRFIELDQGILPILPVEDIVLAKVVVVFE